MSGTGSITHWFKEFHGGSDQAANQLWDFYFERLVKLARRKMGVVPRQTYDEEDVALSAFKSLCNGVRRGGITDDLDRDHLWKLMSTITLRKVYDYIKFSNRQKRNPSQSNGIAIVSLGNPDMINELVSHEPDPVLSALLDEEFQLFLDSLVHHDLKKIAVLKIEGYTNQEISTQLGKGLSTIERKLQTIRKIWQHAVDN